MRKIVGFILSLFLLGQIQADDTQLLVPHVNNDLIIKNQLVPSIPSLGSGIVPPTPWSDPNHASSIFWMDWRNTTNSNQQYDDMSASSNSPATPASGASLPTRFAASNGIAARMYFDGGDYLVVSNGYLAPWNFTSKVSMVIWHRGAVANAVLLGRWKSGATAGVNSWFAGVESSVYEGASRKFDDSGNIVVTGPTFRAGGWHQYGYVADGIYIKVFLDGLCVASNTYSGIATNNKQGVSIGILATNNTVYYWAGDIGWMKVWTNDLQSEQTDYYLNVGTNYGVSVWDATNRSDWSNTVAIYTFDGTIFNASGGYVSDTSFIRSNRVYQSGWNYTLDSDGTNQWLVTTPTSTHYLTETLTSELNGATSLLVTCWVYVKVFPANSVYGMVWDKRTSGTNAPFSILGFGDGVDGRRLGGWAEDDGRGELVWTNQCSSNEWHFIAMSWSSNATKTLWYDATNVISVSGANKSVTHNQSWNIGGSSQAPVPFNGRIDDFRLYKNPNMATISNTITALWTTNKWKYGR